MMTWGKQRPDWGATGAPARHEYAALMWYRHWLVEQRTARRAPPPPTPSVPTEDPIEMFKQMGGSAVMPLPEGY